MFERFHPDVHAYALARLGDWSGAEDVTQEVFVAAVTSIRRLRDEREPAVQAWFLHICRHKVIDHLRRNLRQRRLPVDEPEPASDPQHVVEARLRADELRAALSKLTEDQRGNNPGAKHFRAGLDVIIAGIKASLREGSAEQ